MTKNSGNSLLANSFIFFSSGVKYFERCKTTFLYFLSPFVTGLLVTTSLNSSIKKFASRRYLKYSAMDLWYWVTVMFIPPTEIVSVSETGDKYLYTIRAKYFLPFSFIVSHLWKSQNTGCVREKISLPLFFKTRDASLIALRALATSINTIFAMTTSNLPSLKPYKLAALRTKYFTPKRLFFSFFAAISISRRDASVAITFAPFFARFLEKYPFPHPISKIVFSFTSPRFLQ